MSYRQTERTEKGLFYTILLVAIVLIAASCTSTPANSNRSVRFRAVGIWKSSTDYTWHRYIDKQVVEVDSAYRVGDTVASGLGGIYLLEERVK